MDDQQIIILIRASLRTSMYELGTYREEFLKLYIELLYKGVGALVTVSCIRFSGKFRFGDAS